MKPKAACTLKAFSGEVETRGRNGLFMSCYAFNKKVVYWLAGLDLILLEKRTDMIKAKYEHLQFHVFFFLLGKEVKSFVFSKDPFSHHLTSWGSYSYQLG